MRTMLLRAALGAALLATSLPALAQTAAPTPPTPEQMLSMTPDQRQALHQQLRSLTPDQRKAYREQMKAQFASMTPDQRHQFHEQMRAQRKAAWDALTPEQKQARKDAFQKARAERRAKTDAFVKTLSPAQKKAWDELHQHRGFGGPPQ